MTYYSMQLAECPADATDGQLGGYGAPLREVRNLGRYARDWGPYRLARWAEGRSLRTYWVDSAWVRVETSAEDIAVLFGGLGEELPELDPGKRYLIEAEEY